MSLEATASLASVLLRIEEAAPKRDLTSTGLAEEVYWLHGVGALVEAAPEALTGASSWSDDPVALAGVLRSLGRASLPMGRLFEGHVNAAQLIGLYGEGSLQTRCMASVKAGGFLGVWGADGADPVHAEAIAEGFRLRGAKIFCSGLGVVGMALISARLNGRTSLFAIDVRDARRADCGQWRVSGMRATQSGGYDFNGLELPADSLVGDQDDYFVEPYFLGGMYRMCAVQLGGLDALMDALTVSINRRGKASQFLQQHRVGGVATLRSMAAAVTGRLASMVADGSDPKDIATEAMIAREAVERCITEALQIVERTLGTEVHREDNRLSLVRRDLSFYIRQAAVDERLAIVGATYLNAGNCDY